MNFNEKKRKDNFFFEGIIAFLMEKKCSHYKK